MRFAIVLSHALLVVASAAAPVRAQRGTTVHMDMHLPDSVAHVVDRSGARRADFAIVTRDGKATLLLMDTTIVAQMTDRGLADLKSPPGVDTISDATARMFAKMALGALQPVFDHGIAYHLRDLSKAQYGDGRLQLIRGNGEEVFKGMEMGHGSVMGNFAPADAEAFARKANDARRRLGGSGR
ncbi:MAG: hypothetical protein ABJE47_19330 [bacterium]